MPKFGVGFLVFGGLGGGVVGGVLAPGGGGGRSLGGGWPCVLCVVFDVLLCVLTKCFFRVLLCFSAVVSSQVSSSRFFAC